MRRMNGTCKRAGAIGLALMLAGGYRRIRPEKIKDTAGGNQESRQEESK